MIKITLIEKPGSLTHGWSDYNSNIEIAVGFFTLRDEIGQEKTRFVLDLITCQRKPNHSWFPSFDEAVEWLSMGCNYLLFKFTFVLVCLAVIITLVSRYDALSMKNRSNTSSLDLFNLINHGGPVVFWWYTDLVAIHIHYSYASGARSVKLVHIQKTHWLQESVIISFWSRAFGFD